jgi:hypothetical protein
MTAASNYLEKKVLDHVLRNTAYSQPSGLWLALFNNTSGNAATNLEAGTLTDETSTSGTAYVRKTIAFDAATGTNPTVALSTATVTFDAATADWGTITHVAIMDSVTAGAGNVLFYGAVTTSKTIQTGDTFQVTAGNLTIALA